jgi:hypothetical protein
MRIAEYTRCKELKDVIERNHVLIFNWFYHANFQIYSLPPKFHQELAEVVTGTDRLAADEAMRKHVRYGLSELLKTIEIRVSEEWRSRSTKNHKRVVLRPKTRQKPDRTAESKLKKPRPIGRIG